MWARTFCWASSRQSSAPFSGYYAVDEDAAVAGGGGSLLRLVSKCEVVSCPRQLKVDPERGGHDVLR